MSEATSRGAPPVELDRQLVEEVATELDLRDPNRDALATLVVELFSKQHSGEDSPELVFELATGVGKTYLMAGALAYLARCGVRNFVVFVPRLAIRSKTLNNLTPGHPKSVADGLPDITLITNEDLDSPSTIAAMEDPDQIKAYVLTVQTVAGRDSEVKRRAHTFQEFLGAAFYRKLQALDDLVVFADEHHTYNGPAFSKAVRDLHPMALIGLTATPDKRHTRPEQIVFRYPLTEAVADGYVKRPVIVGRSDEMSDKRTRLHDGALLLREKQRIADGYAQRTGAPQRNLLMLVVAKNIAEAQEVEHILTEPTFFDGEYEGRVLRVDSSQPDEALEALETLEDPASPHRIVVSVQMLKEGWDVATVSVICSLRPEISELLTEQTLGRGMRLPWGRWVNGDIPGSHLLNELDVVAHASYEKLLDQANALKQRRIDRSAWLKAQERKIHEALPEGSAPSEVADTFKSIVGRSRGDAGSPADAPQPEGPPRDSGAAGPAEAGVPHEGAPLMDFDDRTQQAQGGSADEGWIYPRRDLGSPTVPVFEPREVPKSYSLATVFTEGAERFRTLGREFERDPEATLRRTALDAEKETDHSGTVVSRFKARHHDQTIKSDAAPPPLEEARARLIAAVMRSPYATGSLDDQRIAEQIVEAFIDAAGEQAEQVGAYQQQVTSLLLSAMGNVVREHIPAYEEQAFVRDTSIAQPRRAASETSDDRFGPFKRGVGYTGWQRHLYEQAKFDSEPERKAALAIDSSEQVRYWVRLERGDLPVSWTGSKGHTRNYNPDLLVVEHPEQTGQGPVKPYWLVEVKADKDDDTAEVEAKHKAATYWANKTNARDDRRGEQWSVLRITESDLEHANDVWANLKHLGKRAP